MANYKGTGVIASTDYKAVKWVGKTKSGSAVTIELQDALNMGNIDLTFAEKDDVVPELTFMATYSNTNEASASNEEPWTISCADSLSGANSIVLGAGIFYIGGTAVGLTRGGGKFTVEREYREIRADGDRGVVKDRVELVESRASLTMNALTFLGRFKDLFPAVSEFTPAPADPQ